MDHMSKAEIVALIRSEYRNFEEAIAGLTEAQLTAPGAEEQWSVKDIAAHLLFWQQRAVFLLESARIGWRPEKDRWGGSDVDTRNEENFQAQRTRPAGEVLLDLVSSQEAVIDLLESTPEDELFASGRFDWLKGRTLAESINDETYGHYQEHIGSVRAWRAKQA